MFGPVPKYCSNAHRQAAYRDRHGTRTEQIEDLRKRLEIAERVVRVMWPFALSGTAHHLGRRSAVVSEALIEASLYQDALRIVNGEQWMAFENHVVPGPPLPDMHEPGRED